MSLRGDLHGTPMEPPRSSMEASTDLHGVPDNVGGPRQAYMFLVNVTFFPFCKMSHQLERCIGLSWGYLNFILR